MGDPTQDVAEMYSHTAQDLRAVLHAIAAILPPGHPAHRLALIGLEISEGEDYKEDRAD